jgi:diguanylate cyclase (GGDEF)-like protein
MIESYRRLAEVFHHVLSEQDLDNLLDRIADTLAELVPYDALHVYEADNTRRELVPKLARTEWADEVMRTRPGFGQGIIGWAVANREPVLANKAHLDPRVAMVPGTPAEPEALISIPLIARGALKGALNIYRIGEDASFDNDEFELAKWFGDAAALAFDNIQVRASLEHEAQTDSLTGLYNHRFFHERLRAELMRAARAHDTIGLLMFDIDDFKRVNDICGHAVGDQILGAIAGALAALVRGSDVACRIGGEEFAVIMPSCGAGDALGLARRLTERIQQQPIDAAGEVTLSIGVAEGPTHATNPRELVACAEAAMMTGKARGKNRIVVFSEGVGERPAADDSGREAARSIAHLKMLQSVAARLNRFNSVREIAEAIVTELRMLVDYHSCRVYLLEGEELVPIAVKGEDSDEAATLSDLHVPVGFGITGHVAETGRSLVLANSLDCEFGETVPGTDPIDESVVAVPLRYGSKVNGVVFLSQLGVGRFDENDVRLLEVLAGYASSALENARLYETLQREAEHTKAWLEFADELSSAGSLEAMMGRSVVTVTRLLEADQCSLWLEDADGDFLCTAAHGYDLDPTSARIAATRITRKAGEEFVRSRKTPFLMTPQELHDWFFTDMEVATLKPVATAPLPEGHGVKGWITVRAPGAGIEHFTEERLRLLDGLAYRASMALQRALLYREQQENAQVANALLDFGRVVGGTDELEEIYERIVHQTGLILELPEASLWLQDRESGETAVRALWGYADDTRERALSTSYPPETARRFADVPGPFVFVPAEHPGVPNIHDSHDGFVFGIAPFRFGGGRLGFLIAGAPSSDRFDARKLKTLAGLADQAKLAIAGAR